MGTQCCAELTHVPMVVFHPCSTVHIESSRSCPHNPSQNTLELYCVPFLWPYKGKCTFHLHNCPKHRNLMQQIIKKWVTQTHLDSMRQHSPHLWLLKEGLLMTYLVAHFSALGVSNFVNTCVCVCVCVCFFFFIFQLIFLWSILTFSLVISH